MDPALRGHVTGDGEQTIGQIHTRGEHGRFVFLLMGLMPTAGRLICNQIVWVRFPQCPRLPTRMVSVLKLLRNITQLKKMRQQLKGKFTTKPAYTLKCKVNWEYSLIG